MKKFFILLGILVLCFDLADCVLLGQEGFSESPGLSQLGSILPQPYYQHLKVVSADADDCESQDCQVALISPEPDAPPGDFRPVRAQAPCPEVPDKLKMNFCAHLSSSGGIPGKGPHRFSPRVFPLVRIFNQLHSQGGWRHPMRQE